MKSVAPSRRPSERIESATALGMVSSSVAPRKVCTDGRGCADSSRTGGASASRRFQYASCSSRTDPRQPLRLPDGVVGVLDRERGERGRRIAAALESLVKGFQLPVEHARGPSVEGDVMDVHEQDRITLIESKERGAH